MSARCLLCLLPALAAAQVALAEPESSYFERRAEGWFWYQDPAPVHEAPLEPEPAPPAALGLPAPDPVEVLAQLEQQLEQALAAAIMVPNEDNLLAYLRLDQAARGRARAFADAWQQVVWRTPALDHRLVRPVNDQAVQLFNDERVRMLDARLRAAGG